MTSLLAAGRSSNPRVVWLLLPFALGYGVSYFFRNVNAVAGPVLAAEFGLGPGGLGFLTSAYFLAFSLAQVPLGVALDRFGPAKVNTAMLLTAATGAVIFGCATGTTWLSIGRALIGLGAGAALMSAMSAVHLWVVPERRATSIGLVMVIGGIGALVASTPAQLLIDAFGWRNVFFVLAGLALGAACLVWMTRGAVTPAAHEQSLAQLLQGVTGIFGTRYFWTIGLAVMLVLGTMLAFQSLWAATWMRDVAGMRDRIAVGNVLVAFNLGMTAAFLLAGALGDWLARRGVAVERTLAAYCLIALLAQGWLMIVPATLPHLAWGLYSFGANALVLAFSVLARHFPPALTGRVTTALNLLAFGSAFLLQWGIGGVLNLWPVAEGRYDAAGYYCAWLALFAAQAAALAWMLVETRAFRSATAGAP
jgi:MFS family permease